MKCSVVVPAAGSGSRFGGEVPKQFVFLAGRPLIAHTLARLESVEAVREIVVAVAPDQLDRMRGILATAELVKCRAVEGGESRAESVLRGLRSLSDVSDDSIVAIHDAVRPFVSTSLVERLLAAIEECDGSFPGLPPSDTIHVVEEGVVVGSPTRASLVAAQTPQCFRLGVVRRALDAAIRDFLPPTDEVSAVSRLGYRVVVIDGEPDNIKVTRREDLERAERLLAREGG
jgi:2-C-methyl-D-erythritol 4-phosphate cytidylyltransferase